MLTEDNRAIVVISGKDVVVEWSAAAGCELARRQAPLFVEGGHQPRTRRLARQLQLVIKLPEHSRVLLKRCARMARLH